MGILKPGYRCLFTQDHGIGFRSDLSALGCLEALQMAYDNRSYGRHSLIHHSDRGSQYCCEEYVKLLKSQEVGISMTEKHDPYENALAERINGIIKGEFNLYSSQENFGETYERIVRSVATYNEIRPHSSCDYLTPCQAHQKEGELKKRWKKYPKKCSKNKCQEVLKRRGGSHHRACPRLFFTPTKTKNYHQIRGMYSFFRIYSFNCIVLSGFIHSSV